MLAQDFSMGLAAKGLTGFDKNGVHLPQASSFDQWTNKSSTLFVLGTSKQVNPQKINLNRKVL